MPPHVIDYIYLYIYIFIYIHQWSPQDHALLYLLPCPAPSTDCGFGHVATLKRGASANMIHMESDSISRQKMSFWKMPLWIWAPHAPQSCLTWGSNVGRRLQKQGIWLNPKRSLQEGLPKWTPLARHASSWAFHMFRVVKETINTWQRPMGAIKPLLLSPVFKTKQKNSCQLQIYSCSSAKANDRQRTNEANLIPGRGSSILD